MVDTELITIRLTASGIEFSGASDQAAMRKWLHRHFRLDDDVEAIYAGTGPTGGRAGWAAGKVLRNPGDAGRPVGMPGIFHPLRQQQHPPGPAGHGTDCPRPLGNQSAVRGLHCPGPGVLGRESALVGLEGLSLGLNKGKKIGRAAREILSGSLDLESLVREASHRLVTDRLKALHGVGDKVANCVALFSLEQLDSFPVDVHVARSLARHYRDIPRSPEALRRWGQRRFGRYAGYAEGPFVLGRFHQCQRTDRVT